MTFSTFRCISAFIGRIVSGEFSFLLISGGNGLENDDDFFGFFCSSSLFSLLMVLAASRKRLEDSPYLPIGHLVL